MGLLVAVTCTVVVFHVHWTVENITITVVFFFHVSIILDKTNSPDDR